MSQYLKLYTVFYLVVSSLAPTPAVGLEPLDPKHLAEVVMGAEAARELLAFLHTVEELTRKCTYFGYLTPCIRMYLPQKEAAAMVRNAAQRAKLELAEIAHKDSIHLTFPVGYYNKNITTYYYNYTNSLPSYVFFVGKFLAFIPFAAYGGKPASLSESDRNLINDVNFSM
jgi:hypothetical protein